MDILNVLDFEWSNVACENSRSSSLAERSEEKRLFSQVRFNEVGKKNIFFLRRYFLIRTWAKRRANIASRMRGTTRQLCALKNHDKLTLQAPTSTYKFSRVISKHFL